MFVSIYDFFRFPTGFIWFAYIWSFEGGCVRSVGQSQNIQPGDQALNPV